MKRIIVVLCAVMPQGLWAAGPVDPDWPCIQRRQPSLSVGQLWPAEPPAPTLAARARDPEIAQLGQTLALRRTPISEAEQLITAFKARHPPEDHAALFLAAFENLQLARNRVLAGITRYAHKQAALDRHINDQRQQFAALESHEPVDYDALDALETQLDWNTRIFLDRQQSLTYVCETPVILEQRGFTLGRLLAP